MNKTVQEAIRKIVKQELENYFSGEPEAESEEGRSEEPQTRGFRRGRRNLGRGDVKNPTMDRRLKANRGRNGNANAGGAGSEE